MNDLFDILKTKNCSITELPDRGSYLRDQWENSFANHLSDKDKRAIYLFDTARFNGYLWHLFSNEKRDCMEGKKAEQAFNNQRKYNCFVFYQHSDEAFFIKDASMLQAADLKKEQDIYIVDEGFNWTYVQTHEADFGPYFSRGN